MRRARASAGFTLIEILISIVVLSVGVLGVLALHTATIRKANQIATEEYAATLARSIDTAVHDGVRNHSFVLLETVAPTTSPYSGTPVFVKGFLLRHDGVPVVSKSAMGSTVARTFQDQGGGLLASLASGDDAILLPAAPAAGSPEPIFVYPRPHGAAKENPQWAGVALTPGTDDWTTASGAPGLDVERTYKPAYQSGAVFDGSSLFSFALAIRRASAPSIVAPPAPGLDTFNMASVSGRPDAGPSAFPGALARQDGLYEVEILIYRAFDPSPGARNHAPVRRFSTLVQLGF